MLEQQIEQDLKAALLGGDQLKTSTLRGVKSALLNEKIASGQKEAGLSDDQIISILKKQSKQRQESADLFKQGGNQAKADAEIAEKSIIDAYLPAPLSDQELSSVIDEVIAASPDKSPSAMGQIIGQVRSRVGAQAEGGQIAKLVKEKLS